MKILVIDNYDSFTFNLVQLLGGMKVDLTVRRNDALTRESIEEINPDKILISPGPGRPEDSNSSLIAIKEFGKKIPILGVCLGHQAIGMTFGASIIKAPKLMHGKTSEIAHDGKSVYVGIEQNFIATRYHSLIVDANTLPDEIEKTSYSEDKVLMGIRHKTYPIEGIQFHPESILTTAGEKIIKNWVKQ